MGQKSRSKRQNQKKPLDSPLSLAVTTAVTGPSLVAASTTFQPKRRGPVLEELLQVRRSDIAKIALLIAIMAILLTVAAVINSNTGLLSKTGQRLSHIMRIQ